MHDLFLLLVQKLPSHILMEKQTQCIKMVMMEASHFEWLKTSDNVGNKPKSQVISSPPLSCFTENDFFSLCKELHTHTHTHTPCLKVPSCIWLVLGRSMLGHLKTTTGDIYSDGPNALGISFQPNLGGKYFDIMYIWKYFTAFLKS